MKANDRHQPNRADRHLLLRLGCTTCKLLTHDRCSICLHVTWNLQRRLPSVHPFRCFCCWWGAFSGDGRTLYWSSVLHSRVSLRLGLLKVHFLHGKEIEGNHNLIIQRTRQYGQSGGPTCPLGAPPFLPRDPIRV